MMLCKFNHDGDCCNSGATQYMCKCKQPCATIIPITNGDMIRAMTPDEAEQRFNTSACPTPNRKCPDHYCCAWCWLEWLRQPAEGSE